MPRYNYACDTCKLSDVKTELVGIELMSVKSGRLVWEVRHSIKIVPTIKCPLCGKKASITLEGLGAPISWTKGYGYLNRADCHRAMNIHKMQTGQDPYAYLRQPGEADSLVDSLKKGKRSPKKYFS